MKPLSHKATSKNVFISCFFFRFKAKMNNIAFLYSLFATVVLLFIFPQYGPAQPMPEKKSPHHYVIDTKQCDDYIKINGSTNINHFHFEQKLNDQKIIAEDESYSGQKLAIQIPAHDFEPSNPMMYKDFLNFIKAEEYPYINITIFFEQLRLPAGNPQAIIPKIKVGLAGETQTYKIPGEIFQCKKSGIHLQGKVDINLQDFGLEPPTKFMGMVKVNKEVFINFGLTIDNN